MMTAQEISNKNHPPTINIWKERYLPALPKEEAIHNALSELEKNYQIIRTDDVRAVVEGRYPCFCVWVCLGKAVWQVIDSAEHGTFIKMVQP